MIRSGNELLFVYGTLRRGTRMGMHHLLTRHADLVAGGTYQGRMYLIGHYPGAVPSDSPEERVQGEVYTLREPDIVLPKLDQYEECGPGFVSPTEYVRRRQEIMLQGGTTFHAWVYVYNRLTCSPLCPHS